MGITRSTRSYDLLLIILAATFFCDHTFALQAFGVNLRFSQIIAALAAIWLLLVSRRSKQSWPKIAGLELKQVLMGLVVFCAAYLVSAIGSELPARGFIKIGWLITSVLGCFFLIAWLDQQKVLQKGIWLIVIFQSGLVYVDLFSIYRFSGQPLLGSAQKSYYLYEGLPLLRPSGFYTEPSYYAAMLSLALACALIAMKPKVQALSLVTWSIGCAVLFLSSSRLGIVAALILVLTATFVLRRLLVPLLVVTVCLGTLSLVPTYRQFIFDTNGWNKIFDTAAYIEGDLNKSVSNKQKDLTTSEISRIQAAKEGLERWREAPLLGLGIPTDTKNRYAPPVNFNTAGVATLKGGLFPSPSSNTWIELLEESGLLGALTFISMLFLFLRSSVSSENRLEWILFGTLAFLLNFNLVPIFSRFDFWFFFFAFLALASKLKSHTDQHVGAQV